MRAPGKNRVYCAGGMLNFESTILQSGLVSFSPSPTVGCPQVCLGVFQLEAAGRFEIQLPDFVSDPISSSSKMPAHFQLAVREVKTRNLIALRNPESNDLRRRCSETNSVTSGSRCLDATQSEVDSG